MHVTEAADKVLLNENHHLCIRGLVIDILVRTLPQDLLLSRVLSLELYEHSCLNSIEQCIQLRSLKLIGHPQWIIRLLGNISQVNTKLEQLILCIPSVGLLHDLLASIAVLSSLRRLEIHADQIDLMDSISGNGNQRGFAELQMRQKSNRMEQFLQLLNRLTVASKAADYEKQISTIVAAICADENLLPPLQLFLPMEFDEHKHVIDSLAQEYLKQASKSVQHLIPLESLADGNCLFNSVLSIVPDSEISAFELRVRTILELVKNKAHYITQFTNSIGSLDEALRKTCQNNSYCELYELAALANVLRCEIQSVYPYIDYRAEMKIMNTVYKPVDTYASNKGRLIIFWTSTEDELSTRNRLGSGGVWSPNHFVPLLKPSERHRTASNERSRAIPQTPEKQTVKNNQVSLIRSPEFSPPTNIRKQKTSFPLVEKSVSNLKTYDAQRKRQERSAQSEQQRKQRLSADRLSKRTTRDNETEDQQQTRLSADRLSKRTARDNETEDQERIRLAGQQIRSAKSRLSRSKQKSRFLTDKQPHLNAKRTMNQQQSRRNSTETVNMQREQQILEKEQQALLNQYIWPAAIPTQLKNHCLQDFSNCMSMSVLKQSTCIVCNIRAYANTMKEYALQDILSLDQLTAHIDLMNIIPKTQQGTQ
ncbi:unnamed protein product, partial [Adineta steineri]